jgi:hypothetical protein
VTFSSIRGADFRQVGITVYTPAIFERFPELAPFAPHSRRAAGFIPAVFANDSESNGGFLQSRLF